VRREGVVERGAEAACTYRIPQAADETGQGLRKRFRLTT
jgi:hypothetical protein